MSWRNRVTKLDLLTSLKSTLAEYTVYVYTLAIQWQWWCSYFLNLFESPPAMYSQFFVPVVFYQPMAIGGKWLCTLFVCLSVCNKCCNRERYLENNLWIFAKFIADIPCMHVLRSTWLSFDEDHIEDAWERIAQNSNFHTSHFLMGVSGAI